MNVSHFEHVRDHRRHLPGQHLLHHRRAPLQAAQALTSSFYHGAQHALHPGHTSPTALPPTLLPQEISYLTATSVFLAVLDMLFRTGWIHSAINSATENDGAARANGRIALNTIFLIIFMNVMCCLPLSLSLSLSFFLLPHPFQSLSSRSAYTLFFMDRDRIQAFPRRLQHPFSLCFWRLGLAACSMLFGATDIADSARRLET
jgi:hypothetical protein